VKELKKQLANLSPEWEKTVESISTMRRKKVSLIHPSASNIRILAQVLRQLKAVVTHNVDMENISEEDLGKHLDKALRHALDVNYEALKNLNLGAMYVPMEQNPANSKAVSRENTDYDTFGSIDSLIFEPKIPTEEDIEEAQEEITQSFEYLENEDDGEGEEVLVRQKKFDRPREGRFDKNAMAVGSTSFAERVRLFQSLGDKKTAVGDGLDPTHGSPTVSHQGKTTWKEQALQKDERTGRESAASNISRSTNSSGSTVIYNVTIPEEREEITRPTVEQDSFLEESPCGDKQGGPGEDPGECSTCTSLTCSCWEQEDDGCTCADCPGCSQPTLRRFAGSRSGRRDSGDSYSRPVSSQTERPASGLKELKLPARRSLKSSLSGRRDASPSIQRKDSRSNPSRKSSPGKRGSKSPLTATAVPPPPSPKGPLKKARAPPILRDTENLIPVVGNLRRQLRENFNKPSLNIEKRKPKKGVIVDNGEASVARAPSVENITRTSKTVQERIEREESFQKLQTRDQFRSITPESPTPPPLPRKEDGGGLLVEVTNGKPLIFDQEMPHRSPDFTEQGREDMKQFALDSPKNKGSEMGDSGISSNPASMSPHSSNSSGSSASPKAAEEPVAPMKKAVPPGAKKRDTMIRELKFKLKERFPEDSPQQSLQRRPSTIDHESVQSQRGEVGPKLTKIFGSLMSEAGAGPGQATLVRQLRAQRREEPQARNLGVPQDELSTLRPPKLATVKEFDCLDSICPSIYDPSLPPGLEQHVQALPPPPPPTQESSKRGSVLNSSFDEMSIPSRPCSDLATPIDRRELLYGPGGIFGAKGPFSTPGISRYPEVPSTKSAGAKPPPKSSSTSMTEESGLFDGDRSDKSQYICNPVMTLPETDPFVASRLENYRARVSPETPVELSTEQVAALAGPAPGALDRWVEEKQRRMMSWVARGGQVRTQAT
jgi:hypothetical protein